MREWSRTLGDYPASDDYIPIMAEGVAEELAGYDWDQTLRQRDELVIQLLAAKKAKPQYRRSEPSNLYCFQAARG
jgi:carnitine 3-dehydrogenase